MSCTFAPHASCKPLTLASLTISYPTGRYYAPRNTRPLVNQEFLKSSSIVQPENAIVTTMYNDAFAVPIVTLGESLNRVNSTSRRILFYLPDRVSDHALCVATASGFEPHAVARIEPPHGGGVAEHFKDTFTKLFMWKLDELGVKGLVYLDADTLVRRNFDELFLLPFNFAAVPDIYLDQRGFTIAFNTGVLFVRPDTAAFRDLVERINTAEYPHAEGDQGYINAWHGADAVRLPYVYNGNLAIKQRNPSLWQSLQSELRIIHYTLVKPFWRNVYDEIGLDDMHANVLRMAEKHGGLFREEVLEWGQAWKATEAAHYHRFAQCSRSHGGHHVAP